jgi:hypothetical protein
MITRSCRGVLDRLLLAAAVLAQLDDGADVVAPGTWIDTLK